MTTPLIQPAVAADLPPAALGLARAFARGATMWCVAPRWPAHGRHLAVEFVHPVVVGKRALPAVFVDDDPVGELRLVARPGDVVATIGEIDDLLMRVLRRTEPWGLTSVCLGAGRRPPPGTADHVVWIDDVDPVAAAHNGDVVALYHLLWELTHVVFEHPALLDAPTDTRETADADGHCATCSDDGDIGEVRTVGDDGAADVVTGGWVRTVDVSLLPPVRPGDLVLVHAGVALTTIESGPADG